MEGKPKRGSSKSRKILRMCLKISPLIDCWIARYKKNKLFLKQHILAKLIGVTL